MSGIDITNNLKIRFFKLPELELINKPNMIKIEDLINKEDSTNSSDIVITGNIQSNRVRIEDLLNKEVSNNGNGNQISNNKSINNDIKARPGTSESIGSASVMSHDSTISNAHISILEGTKQMVGAAELFTKQ
jgi:hypothetical protein